MPRRRHRAPRLPKEPVETAVEGFSHEGRGIAHVGGKTVFVHGALAGERVRFRYTKRHRKRDEGQITEVLAAAAARIPPRCPHFGVCGGCALQHLAPETQIAHKESVLAEHFQHMGGVIPERWLAPLTGPVWGYRRRARLGVKYVPRKGGRVLVGFREKHSPFVADLEICHVLDPRVGQVLPRLAELVGGLSIYDRVPQIEVALGDETGALALRNLAPFNESDRERLTAFGRAHGLFIYEQPGNEDTVRALSPIDGELTYALPAFDVELAFGPTDFTQINAEINRAMVELTVELLAPRPDERVLDLFCGIGNFSLALARRAGRVVGMEGAGALVERARYNAQRNGIANAEFHVADLTVDGGERHWLIREIDAVLLDPPRCGAAEALASIARLAPRRIVYVSCGPATLARDAGTLVHEYGYRLQRAGVIDMFPHTAHVESIALFERID